jgi:DNA-binding Lrp family transcriptional regulator
LVSEQAFGHSEAPSGLGADVDRLDFAIYRYLSPHGEARFWGGRRLIDPTIPARQLAELVGVSENGVRARLQGLAQQGFLSGTAVTPNPSLFGVRVFGAELPIEEPTEAERILRDLALVEGVIFARDTMDERDRHVRVHFVSDSESTTNRRTSLLRRLAPSGKLREVQPYWIPACDRELTLLDWRILRALVQSPDSSLVELARSVGVSLKTAARRRAQLVESTACWWTHGPECEEYPLALIRLDVPDSTQRDSIAETIVRETAAWIPVAHDGLGLEPEAARTVVAGLVPAEAPVVLERTVKKLAAIPGVQGVHRTFALDSRSYPTWFTERVAEHVPAPS